MAPRKKATVDEVVKQVKEPFKKKFIYHLKISVNDSVTEVDTNDLHESLKEFPVPDAIKTDMVITVSKGDKIVEEVYNVFKGRRAFNNATALLLMASNLTKKLG